MKRILIVDDDAAVTNYFLVLLTQTEQYDPVIVNDSRRAPELLARGRYDAVLLDIDMPELSGIEILKGMRAKDDRTPVVILTGVGDVELAVKAMKYGAFDYLTKPADDEHLLEVLGDAVEHGRLHQSLSALPPRPRREDLVHVDAFERFVTDDPRMIRILHEAEKMALGDATVFILGERGTPRRPLAQAVHRISPRKDGSFVSFDASTEAPEIATSRIFGANRAWRDTGEERPGLFEEADGGTLFIDHVECLSVPAQLRLKRVIQSGEYYRDNSTRVLESNARLVIGSSLDFEASERQGDFSQDLLYHLMINALQIPPLRERRGDIRLGAVQILRREADKTGKAIDGFEPAALELLERCRFPGNDAELESVIASAALRCEGTRIGTADLPSCVQGNGAPERAPEAVDHRKLADVEREYVELILASCRGEKEKAAAELGISVEQMERIIVG